MLPRNDVVRRYLHPSSAQDDTSFCLIDLDRAKRLMPDEQDSGARCHMEVICDIDERIAQALTLYKCMKRYDGLGFVGDWLSLYEVESNVKLFDLVNVVGLLLGCTEACIAVVGSFDKKLRFFDSMVGNFVINLSVLLFGLSVEIVRELAACVRIKEPLRFEEPGPKFGKNCLWLQGMSDVSVRNSMCSL